VSWIGSVGSFFDLRFPVAGPGGFGFPGWGGVGGSYSPVRTTAGSFNPWPGWEEIRVRAGVPITTSADLPGRTHWDPDPQVSVGQTGGGTPSEPAVINLPGVVLSGVGVFAPDVELEEQPPIIYSAPPIILPGQVDPGREEHESEEGEMAHTWLHLGSQVIGGLFPDQNQLPYAPGFGFAPQPGQVPVQTGPAASTGGSMAAYSGSCPPRKTRTLTIDCETGQEVKRKRRRRPKLLTNGDMGMLFQIASLPNNANVRIALAGAIRR